MMNDCGESSSTNENSTSSQNGQPNRRMPAPLADPACIPCERGWSGADESSTFKPALVLFKIGVISVIGLSARELKILNCRYLRQV